MKHETFFVAEGGQRFEPLAHTMDDAAALTGISRAKLYEILNEGGLSGKKLGRRTIILRAVLIEFLHALPDYEAER